MAICINCGKEITGKSHQPGKVRKFCSRECMLQARGKKEYRVSVCEYCGQSFKETRDRINRFCSRKCSLLFYGRERTEKKLNIKATNEKVLILCREYEAELKKIQNLRKRLERFKNCAYCGNVFEAKTMQSIYCSDECRRKGDNQRHDARLKKNGPADYSVTLVKVYQRDGGICQLCGKPLKFEGDTNGPDYPSIDHIQPLSKGGMHTWDNVQLTCRACNITKGAEYER